MPRNAGNAWAYGAAKIAQLMHKDLIELYICVPVANAIGEISDSNLLLVGEYPANVTTPPETIGEEFQGNVRTHYYQIALAPDVQIPQNEKLYVKLIKVRQGEPGVIAEVSGLQGGLLGWTINAADEKN